MKLTIQIEADDLQHLRSAVAHAYFVVENYRIGEAKGGRHLKRNAEETVPLNAFREQVGTFTIDTRR